MEDVVKRFGTAFGLISQAPFVRWLQPAPLITNTAKVCAVYKQSHDGQQRPESYQLAYPGSPVRLEPNVDYIVDFALIESMVNLAQRTNVPLECRGVGAVVISDEYRQIFGPDYHFYYENNEAARLPTDVAPNPGSTVSFLRVPNPGRRHVGFRFVVAGATCTADVVAAGHPFGNLLNEQTVLAAVPELTFASGVADTVPVEWMIRITCTAGIPFFIRVWMSFNEAP
jgi:hypothetical protein